MSKPKKDIKPPKARPPVYEPKVAIKTDFNTTLGLLAQAANKAVKQRRNEPK